jgi:alpha-tubulin suppressor-like RCC1 family protein
MKKTLLLLLIVLSYIRVDAQCWKTISVGSRNISAVKSDKTLWAWGRNNYGQLGDGTLMDKNIPVQIGTSTDWQNVSVGFFHTVALKSD